MTKSLWLKLVVSIPVRVARVSPLKMMSLALKVRSLKPMPPDSPITSLPLLPKSTIVSVPDPGARTNVSLPLPPSKEAFEGIVCTSFFDIFWNHFCFLLFCYF